MIRTIVFIIFHLIDGTSQSNLGELQDQAKTSFNRVSDGSMLCILLVHPKSFRGHVGSTLDLFCTMFIVNTKTNLVIGPIPWHIVRTIFSHFVTDSDHLYNTTAPLPGVACTRASSLSLTALSNSLRLAAVRAILRWTR